MSSNLHPMLNVAIKAARAAGAIINRAALDVEAVRVSQKQVNDFVTEVDHASEAAIIEIHETVTADGKTKRTRKRIGGSGLWHQVPAFWTAPTPAKKLSARRQAAKWPHDIAATSSPQHRLSFRRAGRGTTSPVHFRPVHQIV